MVEAAATRVPTAAVMPGAATGAGAMVVEAESQAQLVRLSREMGQPDQPHASLHIAEAFADAATRSHLAVRRRIVHILRATLDSAVSRWVSFVLALRHPTQPGLELRGNPFPSTRRAIAPIGAPSFAIPSILKPRSDPDSTRGSLLWATRSNLTSGSCPTCAENGSQHLARREMLIYTS